MRALATLLGLACVALGMAACGGDDEAADTRPFTAPVKSRVPCGNETVKLDPADFKPTVENPYFPMRKGSRWFYRGSDKEGTRSTSEVTVSTRTKRIAGITATGLVDRGTEDGKLLEVATEWYAEDKDGNVWYLGEDVKDYEVGEETSSVFGESPFQAGVTMLGRPIPGSCHRLSYEKGESADRFAVLSNSVRVSVPAGRYTNVVRLKQTTPLEPDLIEDRYYARGVGLVLVRARSGEGERVQLVRFTPGK